jgi:predicted RNase H-like nuclease (RuvC/YqgF family)
MPTLNTYDNITPNDTYTVLPGIDIKSNKPDWKRVVVEDGLKIYCHGITLDEVLELIRKHQPERLL